MMEAPISIFRSLILPMFIYTFVAPLLASLPTNGPSGSQHLTARNPFGLLDAGSTPNSAGAFQTPACSTLPNDYIWQVQAQWIIPNIYRPKSLTGTGRWWVIHNLAIDGIVAGCDAQAAFGGLSMNVAVDDSGVSTVVVQGYYQYYPDPPQFFDLAFAVGDHVQMTINSFGWPPTYTLFNLSMNKSAVATPNTKQPPICNKNGAFMVQNPTGADGKLSALAGFDDFTMSQIVYTYYASDCSLDGATIFNAVQNNNVVVTATTSDSSSLLFHSNL